ncbi:VOC family protein [Sphingosinicella sp. YJ22]|uniref:VOC family protein n=1 Tax=Sphingosinicella sp. YJ22 TaxID=1104780 RepID=UPI001407A82C|nr:VOC family protein [Sphingosinicella sp. YJ22]
MIGYVTLGTNDLERARAFYGALLAEIGAKRLLQLPHGFTMWGTAMNRPGLVVTPPYDGGQAVPGNGNMAALVVDSREKVERLHAKALELGGTCVGKPGLRGREELGQYFAYFRDLDGNKLAVFRIGPA